MRGVEADVSAAAEAAAGMDEEVFFPGDDAAADADVEDADADVEERLPLPPRPTRPEAAAAEALVAFTAALALSIALCLAFPSCDRRGTSPGRDDDEYCAPSLPSPP